MKLSALLHALGMPARADAADPEIRHVTRDSRDVRPDSVFVAVVGARTDGHDLAQHVRAACIVAERPVDTDLPTLLVPDSKAALAQIAAALAGHPAAHLRVVGVTGTNGKTTVTTLVEQALEALGVRAGRIGTTGNSIAGRPRPTAFTTPEAPELQTLLAEMRDAGVGPVLMEVSSHGLAQRRVDAVPFHLGVFTNLTGDHLDFHGTMEAYADAKAMLFQRLRAPGGWPRALLWGDDPAWPSMRPPADRWLYGLGPDADVRADDLALTGSGVAFTAVTPAGTARIDSGLIGRHNALNLLAALGVLICLDVPLPDAARALGTVRGAPGRLEAVPNDRGLLVLVDYAHSDDALATVLPVVSEVVTGRTWVLFGCGGDRDRTKRPRMGAVAERLADFVVLASDNPRSEDPDAILDAIQAGMQAPPAFRSTDRRAAIAWVLSHAALGDAVLIAGKGHETTQEIAGTKHPFDDRLVARAALEA